MINVRFNLKTNIMKNSKRIVYLTLSLVLLSFIAFAQKDNGFGIKVGLNYGSNGDISQSFANAAESPDRNIGYHLGIFGKLGLGSQIYLRPELVYTKTKSDYNSSDFDMSKLDLPVLLGINVIGPINVFAGPSFQYILDTEFENITLGDVENDFTVGLNFGVGLNLNNIGIDLRYERGLSENESAILDSNNLTIGTLDTRPEQLILSLSIKI